MNSIIFLYFDYVKNMSVTEVLNRLELMETNFHDKITKLNKYYIGQLVKFQEGHNTIVAECKLLKDELENVNKKYFNVCEEINDTKMELNTLKDIINKSNINFSTNEKMVEKIETLNLDADENKIMFDKNTIKVTVTDILQEQRVCDDIITVKKEINELKQNNICDDIVITGIPESNNENLLETVNSLLVQYDIVVKSTDLKSIYRLKNMKCGVNSPILLVLKDEHMKSLIMEKQKINGPILLPFIESASLMNPQKVFFKHRLTTENLTLLRNVRRFCRENLYQFVWTTNDGKILIKKTTEDRPIKISSIKDLELLKI